jgi:hypothetical protein
MWSRIYGFFEQYAGVSYNFVEEIDNLKENTFIEPYAWESGIQNIMDNLQEALDYIDTYGMYLGEDMPSPPELEKIVATYVLTELRGILDTMKQSLSIEPNEINDFDTLENQLFVMGELVDMCVNHSLDEIMADDLFNTFTVEDEDDDNQFEEALGLNEKDIPNIFMTIQSIRDDYFASLDDDE